MKLHINLYLHVVGQGLFDRLSVYILEGNSMKCKESSHFPSCMV